MNEKKVKGVLKDERLSKDAHAIEFFASVAEKYPIHDYYEIPQRYNIDTIVIMPVNPERVFIYWEITEDLLKSKRKEVNSPELTVKIFEVNLGAPKKKQEKEVYSFNQKEKIGSRYVDYPASLKPLAAKIGVTKNDKFMELLKAKPISIPSFEVLAPDDNLWTERLEGLPYGEVIIRGKPPEERKKEDIITEIEILKQIFTGRSKDTEKLGMFMELLKGFLEIRSKDIELLRLFLDFIEQLQLLEIGGESLLRYFEELRKRYEEVSSSELFGNRQVNP